MVSVASLLRIPAAMREEHSAMQTRTSDVQVRRVSKFKPIGFTPFNLLLDPYLDLLHPSGPDRARPCHHDRRDPLRL